MNIMNKAGEGQAGQANSGRANSGQANSLSYIVRKIFALVRLGLISPRLMRLAWELKREKKTFLSYITLLSLARSYFTVKSRHPQEHLRIAEFGVGRGGSAIFMGWLANRFGGTLSLYDLFGQIPAPSEKDGQRAQVRYRVILEEEAESYYGNIPNLLELIQAEMARVIDLEQVTFIQGRYEDTLQDLEDPGAFNLVHIDCDWYESSKAVLDYLSGHLKPGAIIQVDDYSNWQGSKQALDEAEWLGGYRKKLVDGALNIDTGVRTN
jgi:hypothetical protein